MKYKKYSYILLLILMLIVGIDKTYAKDTPAGTKYCYYMSNDGNFKASVKLNYGYKHPLNHGLSAYTDVSIDKIGDGVYTFNDEGLLNWWPNGRVNCVKNSNVCFNNKRYQNSTEANNDNNPSCPEYIVFQSCHEYRTWWTDSEDYAKNAVNEINKNDKCTGYYATYKKNGHPITSDAYYSEFIGAGIIEYDISGEPTCADYDELFGDKNDENSISYDIHTILNYVRIIVPILIILLGTIDFAKAVIAAKEDQMRKAQMDFIKRVIIGVAVFFVPLLVDVIMELADIVWAGEYIHCKL